MNLINKYANHWIVKVGIAVIAFLAWLLPYVNKANFFPYELTMQIILTALACLSLLMISDVTNVLLIFMLFPFTFSRSFEVDTAPIHLYILVGVLLICFILHFFIHKVKITKPKFIIGFSFIGISMITGGILTSFDNKLAITALLALIAISFLALYLLFTSSSQLTFKDLALMMLLLGVMLMSQYITWGCINPQAILSKSQIRLGWASASNNLGMMLLFTYPFIWYLGYKNKGIMRIGCFALTYLNLFIILLSYSRGSILAIAITGTLMAIGYLIYKPTRKVAIIYVMTMVVIFLVATFGCYIFAPNVLDAIWKNITKINLDNLNGRTPIYNFMISKFKEEPLFGYGLFYPLTNPMNDPKFENYQYLWGHNTFLQTAYTLGSFGLLAMLWHFVEKYLFCFKQITFEKIILLAGLIATDIYGFLDVSYFFINYMVVLLVVLIAVDKVFDGEKNNAIT